MKPSRLLFSMAAILLYFFSQAQTADEIINNYLEASGGEENWRELTATKMIGEIEYAGMLIPLSIYSTKDGKQAFKIEFIGQEVTQLAYDGEVLWTTNSNMKPQKADEESTQNMAYSKNDFPSPFLDYESKNHRVKLVGKTKIGDKEAYKILLIQEPVSIDGLEEESLSYYYFNTETYLPIMVEREIKNGPMKGQLSVSTMKNYKKVEGLYFPFLLNENGQDIKINKILLNPELDDKIFEFPNQ